MASTNPLVPGIIGFAPATDAFYLTRIQQVARKEGSAPGLVDTLPVLYTCLAAEPFFGAHRAGRDEESIRSIRGAAERLARAGADFLVVTSNTGSIILESAPEGPPLPVLDVFEATAAAAAAAGSHAPGLLGTRSTIASGRYDDALARLGLRLIPPQAGLVDRLDRMIDGEAVRGIHSRAGRDLLAEAVQGLADAGADAVLLGCTDLVLFGADSISGGILPVVDSSTAHADAAARRALAGV